MGNSGSAKTNTLEDLGAKIYDVVFEIYPNEADKITGMLLDGGEEETASLLSDEKRLNERIIAAASLLGDKNSQRTPDLQSLGDRVYGTVQQLYPTLAERVTGMLLEMPADQLIHLLDSREGLLEHIHTAAHVLMESKRQESIQGKDTEDKKVDNASVDENGAPLSYNIEKDKTEDLKSMIGENIYSQLVEKYPKDADKITGMLLEMELDLLQKVSQDPDLLGQRATEAVETLHQMSKQQGCGDENLSCTGTQNKSILNTLESDAEVCIKSSFDETEIRTAIEGLSEPEQKEFIGEKIHDKIRKLHPGHADVITGMLLEMGVDQLLNTILNPALFSDMVQQSYSSLT
ncbi:uncharacterized protein LOC5510140 [Nematostella vectensis]|uniref:uncharacterized protein LOC5510140 n=1 Tax=Nematostella vectensis TaxID=45351 RepID=UPI002077869A|nr:uncharacterized protein LOC5510140 [Nematostella vectensis]